MAQIARQLEKEQARNRAFAARSKPTSGGEFYDRVLELRPEEFSQFGRMPGGMHHLENRTEELAVRKRAQVANWELVFERRGGLLRGEKWDGA